MGARPQTNLFGKFFFNFPIFPTISVCFYNQNRKIDTSKTLTHGQSGFHLEMCHFAKAGNKTEPRNEESTVFSLHIHPDQPTTQLEGGVSDFLIFGWHFITAENGKLMQTFDLLLTLGGQSHGNYLNPESRPTRSDAPAHTSVTRNSNSRCLSVLTRRQPLTLQKHLI